MSMSVPMSMSVGSTHYNTLHSEADRRDRHTDRQTEGHTDKETM